MCRHLTIYNCHIGIFSIPKVPFLLLLILTSINNVQALSVLSEIPTPAKIFRLDSRNEFQHVPGGFTNPPLPGGDIFVGEIPKDPNGKSDGQGLMVVSSPGNVDLFMFPKIDVGEDLVLLRGFVHTSAKDAGIALVALDGSMDGSIATNIPSSSSMFQDGFHVMLVLYDPPGDSVVPVFQVSNASETQTIIAYFDNLEVYRVPATIGIHPELLRDAVRYTDDLPVPTPTNSLTPTPFSTPISTSTPIPTQTVTQTPVLPGKPIIITGTVVNDLNYPVRGAKISIGETRSITSILGYFTLTLPRPGIYTVSVDAVGYPLYTTVIEFNTTSSKFRIEIPRAAKATPISESTPKITPTSINTPTRLIPTPTKTPTSTKTPTPTHVVQPFPVLEDLYGEWRYLVQYINSPLAGTESMGTVEIKANNILYFYEPTLGKIPGTYMYDSRKGILSGKYTINVNSPSLGGQYYESSTFTGQISSNFVCRGSFEATVRYAGMNFTAHAFFETEKIQ